MNQPFVLRVRRVRVTSQMIIAKVPVVPGEPGFNFGAPKEQQWAVVLWAVQAADQRFIL